MKTVLVLDDNDSILPLIRLVVEQQGYVVLGAKSAQEAFERFEENDAHVDLLIADVTLPVSSGILVALELRSFVPYLKIILTSGYPASMDSIRRLIGLPYEVAPALTLKAAAQ